jgi:hypothetical protein
VLALSVILLRATARRDSEGEQTHRHMIKPTRLIGEYAPRVLFTAVVPTLQQAKKCGCRLVPERLVSNECYKDPIIPIAMPLIMRTIARMSEAPIGSPRPIDEQTTPTIGTASKASAVVIAGKSRLMVCIAQ